MFGLIAALATCPAAANPQAVPPPSSSAQPAFNLTQDQAVARALEANPRLTARKRRVEAAGGSVQGLVRMPNPILDIGVSGGGTAVGSRDEDLILTQSFDASGQRKFRRQAAVHNLSAAESELLAEWNSLVRDVRLAYIDAQVAAQQRALYAEDIERATKLQDIVTKQVERGAAANTAATRAQIQLVRAQQALNQSELVADAALVKLRQLVGVGQDRPIALESELGHHVPPQPGELAALQAVAHRERPELQALDQSVESQEMEARAVHASRRPDAVVYGRRARVFEESDAGVRAAVVLPIFDFGSIAGAERQARGTLAERRALRDQESERIDAEVASALRRDRAARAALRTYATGVLARSEELYAKAERAYQAGVYSLIELLDAEETLLQARLGFVNSHGEMHRASIELEWALGGFLPPALAKIRAGGRP